MTRVPGLARQDAADNRTPAEIAGATSHDAVAAPSAAADDSAMLVELAAGRPIALFLDFDGTLSPIVPDPAAAQLDPDCLTALEAVARRCPVTLVSGRGLHDLAQRVPVSGLRLAGSHGFELDRDPQPPVATLALVERLAVAADRLRSAIGDRKGVLVERKPFAVAVHWRHADPADLPAIEAALAQTAQALGGLRQSGGKAVSELRPDLPWHKGAVTAWLLDGSKRPHFPVFVGDDVTDLDGFVAVRERGGIAVAVGDALPAGSADLVLAGPPEVARLLMGLARRLAA